MNRIIDKSIGKVEYKEPLFLYNNFNLLDDKFGGDSFTNTLSFVYIINNVTNDADWLLRQVLQHKDITEQLKNWKKTIFSDRIKDHNNAFILQNYKLLDQGIKQFDNEVTVIEHDYDKYSKDIIDDWYRYLGESKGNLRSEDEVKKAMESAGYKEISSINMLENNPLKIYISRYKK